MRLLAVLAAMLLLLPGACAEGVSRTLLDGAGFEGIAQLSDALDSVDATETLRRALTGELPLDEAAFRRLAARFGKMVRDGLLDAFVRLAPPVVISLILSMLLDGRGSGGPIALICRLACALALMERFAAMRSVAREALAVVERVIDAATPVLVSVMTFAGAGARAAILSPASALCADLIGKLLTNTGIGLCGVAAAVAAVANLSDQFQLNRLFRIIKRGVVWAMGLIMGGFVGIMALEGALATGQDAASARSLRRAIASMIPIIGGEVSDSAGALMGSAIAVKNAVGVTSMLVLLGACATAVCRIAAAALSMKLAAAVIEPVADSGTTRVAENFAEVMQMLLAVCIGAVMLALLLIGACLSMPQMPAG